GIYRQGDADADAQGDDPAAILETLDGGVTWSRIGNADGSVGSLSFADPNHGWALTATGAAASSHIDSTDDGGYSWTPLRVSPPDPLEAFISISLVRPTVGYVGTNWGTLLRSTDGGRSFETILQGSRRPFYTFRF